jgi:hypothetical protein
MKSEPLSFPILISFTELALIAVFAVVMLHGIKAKKLRGETEKAVLELGHSRTELDVSQQELAQSRADLAAIRQQLETATGELQNRRRLTHSQGELDGLEERRRAAEENYQKEKKNAATQKALAESLQAQLAASLQSETAVRREVAGLCGKLDRVAFVFDRSASMSRGGRWESACATLGTWIEHLNIREGVLITFNNQTQVFPKDAPFLTLTGDDGTPHEANRRLMLNQLKGLKPAGTTDTLSALQLAYAHGVDTILLFSDGEPDLGGLPRVSNGVMKPFTKALTTEQLIEEIYGFCKEQRKTRKVVINTIGLGDYFNTRFGGFMIHLAEITEGTFIGR